MFKLWIPLLLSRFYNTKHVSWVIGSNESARWNLNNLKQNIHFGIMNESGQYVTEKQQNQLRKWLRFSTSCCFTIPEAVRSLIDYGDPYFLTAVSSLIQLLLPLLSSRQVILQVITAKRSAASLRGLKNDFNAKPQRVKQVRRPVVGP